VLVQSVVAVGGRKQKSKHKEWLIIAANTPLTNVAVLCQEQCVHTHMAMVLGIAQAIGEFLTIRA
jgi:hypothetical protein